MTLTWKEFLNLAAVVQNLNEPLENFFYKRIDIKELNRRVAKAAQDYLDLFKDAKPFFNLLPSENKHSFERFDLNEI